MTIVIVIPAKAGISWSHAATFRPEPPAFAGVTFFFAGVAL